MTLEQGTLLNDRYRIVEILGQGGMGSVYRAVDENLSVEVAVKENLFTSDDYSRQFRLEAVILASVRQQHLPRVTDHFMVGDSGQYLVMDYIEGEDLRQRMERLGRITEEDAILIGAAVCEALTYLHSRKPPVLHRDIKPGNIKITPDGGIFLVDFGLAKLVQGSQTTTTGARAMTPGYSPPEQYGTARTDPRSDIYSLGATLYAALCGVIPEDGLARVMDNLKLTPIRDHNSKISRKLAASIEKAMEAYPDDRFQTAESFRHGLLSSSSRTLRFIDTNLNISVQPPPAQLAVIPDGNDPVGNISPVTPRKTFGDNFALASFRMRRRLPRFSGLGIWAGLVLVLAAGWFSWANSPAFRSSMLGFLPPAVAADIQPTSTTPPSATLPPPTQTPVQEITPTPAITTTSMPPTPTPLGGGWGELAFVSTRTGSPQVYYMKADGTDIRQVTNERDGACQPDWSPDGQKIVYISPCRQKQETYQGSSLFIIDVNTHDRTALPVSLGGDFEPAWSPDGKFIAFTSLRDGYMEIYKINLENNQFTRLTRSQSIVGAIYARQPAWNPYGTQIVYVLKRMGLSQIWLTSDGDANLSKPNFQLVQSGNKFLDTMPAWSPDGQYIVFDQTNFDGNAPASLMTIRYEDRATKQAVPINIQPLPVVDVSFSPDGQWLAFESWPDTINYDIYITTVNGSNRARLTTDPDMDFDPVWRPVKKN